MTNDDKKQFMRIDKLDLQKKNLAVEFSQGGSKNR